MLGEGQSLKQAKGKPMKPGRTLGVIAVFVGGLLVTLTSVYADHFMAGGVIYSPTSDLSETSVQCQFLGVKSSVSPDEFVIPTTIQCTVVNQGGSMSFRLSISGTDLDPFTVETDHKGDIVTITGKMLSTLVLGVGSERRQFTEIAPFEAVGVDVAIPGAGLDSFTLTLDYSASQDIGPLLLAALRTPLVQCKRGTCTLTVAGTVIDGDVEGHTAAGE